MLDTALPPFPDPVVPAIEDTGLWHHGITLRAARTADLPFLRALYAGFRAEELAPVPWPDARKRAFLDDQFRLQHVHFTRFFPACDFHVIEHAHPPFDGAPVGRLYLDRSAPRWRIIDIGLVPQARGAGLGGSLLRWIQQCAAQAGAEAVDLHVLLHNPRAHALYRRLGFRDAGAPEGQHQPMEWRVI